MPAKEDVIKKSCQFLSGDSATATIESWAPNAKHVVKNTFHPLAFVESATRRNSRIRKCHVLEFS